MAVVVVLNDVVVDVLSNIVVREVIMLQSIDAGPKSRVMVPERRIPIQIVMLIEKRVVQSVVLQPGMIQSRHTLRPMMRQELRSLMSPGG